MESSPPLLPIIFSLIAFVMFIVFSIRFYLKKNKQTNASPHYRPVRKEIQSIDSGAVISPEGSKKYSEHWEKYRDGNALLDAQKIDEAIVIFKSLAAIPEEEETALVSLGTCYNLQGRYAEAITCYQRSIQLNDTHFNAFLGMGTANYHAAHYPTAVVYYKKANALNPEIPDAYWGLAIAYHMMKENQLASDNAKIFIQMVPDSKYRKYLEGMIID